MAPEAINEETGKEALTTTDKTIYKEEEDEGSDNEEEKEDEGSDNEEEEEEEGSDNDEEEEEDEGSDNEEEEEEEGSDNDEEEEDEGSDIEEPWPGPEPEWDVDSYEGLEYESDPEVRQCFSDENEYEEYSIRKRRAFANQGFVVEPLNGIYPFELDDIVIAGETVRDLITKAVEPCIKWFNNERGTSLELVEIVRANSFRPGRWYYYITFMAREYPNGPLVEYQAKAVTWPGNTKGPFPIFCRPKS